MGSDPTSPIAPARINALILPAGRVKRSRFRLFVDRIRKEDVVRLGDISPDTSTDKALFSSLAFPNGSVLYNFSQSCPPAHQLSYSPFELFREPLLVLCVADYAELFQSPRSSLNGEKDPENYHVSMKIKLESDMQAARDRFPRALHVQLLVFDAEDSASVKYLPRGTKKVPPLSQSRPTSMKTIFCDISAILLAEMSLLASSIQQPPALVTPGASPESSLGETSSLSSISDAISSTYAHKERVHSISPPSSRTGSGQLPSLSEAVSDTSRPASPTGSEHAVASSGHMVDSPQDLSPRQSSTDLPSRPRNADIPHGAKRDRKSMPPSTIPAERAKMKLKARQGILLGSLFLHSGRWPDALRELVENATRARAFGDHRWFAKALENVLVAMLLLAWADMEFTVPSICLAHSEKSTNAKQSSSISNGTIPDIRPSSEPGNRKTLLALSSAIPEIVKNIINGHSRADAEAERTFPPFVLSDCVVRLGRLYSFLYRSWGTLNKRTLDAIVSSEPRYSAFRRLPRSVSNANTRREISFLLFRAFPARNDYASDDQIAEDISILCRMASVLSFAGLERKQAMVQRDILSLLTPAFIQARKRGAAELGIHPAASLSIIQSFKSKRPGSQDEMQKTAQDRSLRSLIAVLCKVHGIELQESLGHREKIIPAASTETVEMINPSEAILRDAWLCSFGSIDIKHDILRLATNLSEALPDFEEVLRSISTTFRTVGATKILPLSIRTSLSGPLRTLVMLSEEEQTRLSAKFYRLVESVPSEDISNIEAAYWDRFLLRNVELSSTLDNNRLFLRRKPQVTAEDQVSDTLAKHQGIFLHDAFGKATVEQVDKVLVAGENTNFLVTFQNPYSFEIFIEHVNFTTEGVELEHETQSFALGPCIVRKVMVSATPLTGGKLTILGCRIKIRGCREENFLLFREHWSMVHENKIKHSGLLALPNDHDSGRNSRPEEVSADPNPKNYVAAPEAATVSFKVLSQQPILEVQASSLPQSNITLLAGQTVSYSVTLRNLSANTPCDFVSASFKEAVRMLGSNQSTPGFQDMEAFTIPAKSLRDHVHIAPGASKVFAMEILGMPSVTEGFICFDYAYIGSPLEDVADSFYTRQLKLHLHITVNSTIELLRADATLLEEHSGTAEGIIATLIHSNTTSSSNIAETFMTKAVDENQALRPLQDFDLLGEQGVFVLLLDLRNSWSRSLWVTFYLKGTNEDRSAGQENNKSLLCNRSMIQAGQITRVALPLPRITADATHVKSKSAYDRHENMQSLYSKHSNVEEELCKEILIDRVVGIWEDLSTGTQGSIDLQGLRLTPQMINTIRQKDLTLDLSLSDGYESRSDPAGSTTFKANQLLCITTTVTNKSSQTLTSVVRLRPQINGKSTLNDMARHVAWTSAVERHVANLEAAQQTRISTGLTFLNPGRYEILATAHSLIPLVNKIEDNPGVPSRRTSLLGSFVLVVNIEDE